MSSCFMTTDPPIFHYPETRTAEWIRQLNYSFFQSCSRCYDLKSRTWFIGIIDTGIAPHGI